MAVYRQDFVVAKTVALVGLVVLAVLTLLSLDATLGAMDARPNWPIVALLLAVTVILVSAFQVRRESSRHVSTEATLRAAFANAEDRAHVREIERDQVQGRLHESEAREARAQEMAAEANLLRDEFLATVSHELRTPLNVIVGWTRLARSAAATD